LLEYGNDFLAIRIVAQYLVSSLNLLTFMFSEHLKDVHDPKRLCRNCLRNFHKSEEKFLDHKSMPCEKRDSFTLNQPETISSDQKAVFGKLFDTGTSDEDKWREYYHILFPNELTNGLLSPCKLLQLTSPEINLHCRFQRLLATTTYDKIVRLH
jgi:hypothetical protein